MSTAAPESGTQLETRRPRVAIIILAWNRADEVATCLESFACVDYPNYEVVVVDNASADGTPAMVRERFPWATLIVNAENYGFCKGNNVGLRYALEHGAQYVMLLNQDTKMTPTVLSELVRVMESDPRIAITGAKNLLMEDPRYTWGKYGVLSWGPLLVRTVGNLLPDEPVASPQDVDWVIGNGCMMRREALERVGLLDEMFFQLEEDVDWCTCARELGYRVVFVDAAAIYHKGSSSGDVSKAVVFHYGYFLGRNAILFARKHATVLEWARLLAMMTGGLILRALFHGSRAAYSALRGQRVVVDGIIDGFRGGRLRPDHITVRVGPAFWRMPADTPFVRFLRWIGA
jgi:GT2 family glycosyltransferase